MTVTDVRNIQRATSEDFLLQSLIVRFSEKMMAGEPHRPTIVPSRAAIEIEA